MFIGNVSDDGVLLGAEREERDGERCGGGGREREREMFLERNWLG